MTETQVEYYAHSPSLANPEYWEPLELHIRRVMELAHAFGVPLRMGDAAAAAAMLHDLGKYADHFQHYLRGEMGFGSRDHSTAGALAALMWEETYLQDEGSLPEFRDAVALSIAAHHTELERLKYHGDLEETFRERIKHADRVTSTDSCELEKRWLADGFTFGDSFPVESELSDIVASPVGAMLDTRMLFSCLVDADYLATEGHFHGTSAKSYQPRASGPSFDFAAAADHVEEFIRTKLNRSEGAMQRIRDQILDDCISASAQATGCLKLTAPTGAGKTYAMLLFALRHAAQHNLQRVVFVMPFLTIIDQSVRSIKSALKDFPGFTDLCLIEDHSLADGDREQKKDNDEEVSNSPVADAIARARRLLAENWDAPIVLTSSVKCLESLHASRPSACRKLHRMANAVLLFDEVQAFPPELAILTLATLTHLSHRFRSTVVLSTATQPNFEHLDRKLTDSESRSNETPPVVSKWTEFGWSTREIVTDVENMFRLASGRVVTKWQIDTPASFADVANEMVESGRSALAIVNLKRHAVELFNALPENQGVSFHLSTSMCPAHRENVLEEIRARLNSSSTGDPPVRLVATQCVEAGVDLSFQSCWRAMAPLESIAQAAGRCNRSGEFDQPGLVTVFCPDVAGTKVPPGYDDGIDALKLLLKQFPSLESEEARTLLNKPELIQRYYRKLYTFGNSTAPSKELKGGVETRDFQRVAAEYRLIKTRQLNILVPYDECRFKDLLERYERGFRKELPQGWLRDWFRDARPHTIGVYTNQFQQLQNFLEPIPFSRAEQQNRDQSEWWCLFKNEHYDRKKLGLVLPDPLEGWVL